ncbi:hypothetical protein FQN54_000457 [Arachnomyces sp. PD_36]|nr:hypothetical protein FQN54_000457 [Arachnomyces sp. PD_36]
MPKKRGKSSSVETASLGEAAASSASASDSIISLNIKGVIDRERFSDFTIKVEDREIQVHKLVLYTQSRYFATLLKTENWKERRGESGAMVNKSRVRIDKNPQETETNSIELHEDDPRAIEAMIRFMYDSTYNFGYTSDHKDKGYDHGCGDISSTILFIRTYAAGEKYQIPSLKERAAKSFTKSLYARSSSLHILNDFSQIVEEVYTCAILREDRVLRDALIRFVDEKREWLMGERCFEDAVCGCGEFGMDLVLNLMREKDSCQRCGTQIQKYIRPSHCGLCAHIERRLYHC